MIQVYLKKKKKKFESTFPEKKKKTILHDSNFIHPYPLPRLSTP